MHTLRDVARDTETRWAGAGYRDDELPDIALEALAKGLPTPTQPEIVDALLNANLPLQTVGLDNSFGQPPFSIFESDKLVMQILIWHDATTVIHQHSFSGAFAVLVGSSLHCQYAFIPQRSWSPHLKVGALALQGAERLSTRDVRPIQAGDRTIHSLFHLGDPSISVVLRSKRMAISQPQLNYVSPGLATDPFHRPPLAERRRQLIVTLFRMLEASRVTIATEHIARTDPVDAVELVLELAAFTSAQERRALIDAATACHGDELTVLEEVGNEHRRTNNLTARRAKITDADQRYLLALLLNAPDRATFIKLAATHAEDPIGWTLGTLRALQQKAVETADDEAGLGIVLDEAALFALAGQLRGQAEEELLEAAPAHIKPGDLQKACFLLPHMSALSPLFR